MQPHEIPAKSYYQDHPDAILILTPEGQILDFNPAVTEMLGYTREDLLGQNTLGLIEFVDVDTEIVQMMIRNVFDGENHLAELKVRRKDGVVLAVELLMNRIREGDRDYLAFTFREINMRKQVESAMRESEDRYRSLVDLSPFAIFIVTNGRIVYLNPAGERLLRAQDSHQVIGQELVSFIHPADREFLPQCEDEDPDTAARFRNRELEEFRWLDVKGQQVDVQSICLPIYYKGVSASQIIGLDITAKKQLEEQLRQAQKLEAIGMLAGGIAHDFNNILTGIIGFAGLGASTVEPRHPATRYFKNIEDKSQEAASLIHQLLAFSRKEILNFHRLDLNHVVEGSVEFLGHVLPEDIDLILNLAAGAHPIHADPTAMQQILTNLCVNARDAMKEGGSIFIETDRRDVHKDEPGLPSDLHPGSYYVLRVRDLGEGISPDVLENIYNPFFTTKEIGKGSGLGLSMVYGLMQQHNGFVHCESRLGEGTTFTLFFPRTDAAGQIDQANQEPEETPGGRETILVAEDDVDVLSIVQGILKGGGYTVKLAKNGRVALEILQEQAAEIDLVISDLVMPEMSGMELFNQVEHLPHRPEFLFISGYARSSEVQRSRINQEIAFLRKPFTSTQLTQKIRDLLDRRRNS